MQIKKSFVALSAVAATLALLISNQEFVHSNSTGAPGAYTGAPKDNVGRTCASQAGCHTGGTADTTSAATLSITSNVPGTGYVPGTTYKITAHIAKGKTTYGFQISPQSSTSNVVKGTIKVTDATQTQLQSGKYITHRSSGIAAASKSKTWSFDWVAPAKGSGDVTFYGAFNAANSNANSTGDIIYTTQLELKESITNAIEEFGTVQDMFVYPSLAGSGEKINVNFSLNEKMTMMLSVYNLQGQLIQSEELSGQAGLNAHSLTLNHTGAYIIHLSSNYNSIARQILVH